MKHILSFVILPVALIHCRPGEPTTGIYVQKVLKQSGSCEEMKLQPVVLLGIGAEQQTLSFNAPLPGGMAIDVTIPAAGGTFSGCEDKVAYEARVREWQETSIKLDLDLSWDEKDSSNCPSLAVNPASSCRQSFELEYSLMLSCEPPCSAKWLSVIVDGQSTNLPIACSCGGW